MKILVVLTAMALFLPSAGSARGGDSGDIRWPRSIEIAQGELVEVKINSADITSVQGRWGQKKIYFYSDGDGAFSALLGADVDAQPTRSKLTVKVVHPSGRERRKELAVTIKAKKFRTESFKVPPNFDRRTAENIEEIRREQAAFKRAFRVSAPDRFWEAPFVRPVPHQASASSFGSRRIINGAPRAPHSGTDLSAPLGAEVKAANHGRVVLVDNFFFAGGSVVLDHGGGLFTMYFHLSEFKVEQDSMVKRGQVIGLSGATGRVTGPHLHWGARLANARIEPFELLKKISNGGRQAQGPKAAAQRMEK